MTWTKPLGPGSKCGLLLAGLAAAGPAFASAYAFAHGAEGAEGAQGLRSLPWRGRRLGAAAAAPGARGQFAGPRSVRWPINGNPTGKNSVNKKAVTRKSP